MLDHRTRILKEAFFLLKAKASNLRYWVCASVDFKMVFAFRNFEVEGVHFLFVFGNDICHEGHAACKNDE
jgi:hypothetical protein